MTQEENIVRDDEDFFKHERQLLKRASRPIIEKIMRSKVASDGPQTVVYIYSLPDGHFSNCAVAFLTSEFYVPDEDL